MSGRGEPRTEAGRRLLAAGNGDEPVQPDDWLGSILAIEAAAAREALEALVPWFGQADALYLRRERDAAYVTSTHNGYTDVRSTWLAEVMTLLAALRAARASDGGR